MKITFPHMGRAYIPIQGMLDKAGLESVVPDRPHRRGVELGARYAPEFVCLPFKSTLGDFIDGLEKGADTLAMVCGMWACRFGYYGRVQHQILRDLGYEFDSILIGKDDLASVFGKLTSAMPRRRRWRRVVAAIAMLKARARIVDEWEWEARRMRPLEQLAGSTDELLADFFTRLETAPDRRSLRRLRREAAEALATVPLHEDRQPLKVALLGEVYMVLEPNLNLELERLMGELGMEVHPALTLYRWLLKPFRVLDLRLELTEAWARRVSRPYVRYVLGGEEHWTIAGTIRAAKRGYDGVVHVYPLTCMPENICRSILPKVTQQYEIPLLDLCFDEHSSPVGIRTRLEAFGDLLERRRTSAAGSA